MHAHAAENTTHNSSYSRMQTTQYAYDQYTLMQVRFLKVSTSLHFAKNDSGQPGDENIVGNPLGDVMLSISFISAAESL